MTSRLRHAPALAGLALLLSTAACGNAVDTDDIPDVVGAVGVSVDDAGAPVIIGVACTGHLDTVEIVGGREGLADDEPNPEVGTWRTSSGLSLISLDLADPQSWDGPADVVLDDDALYLVSARGPDNASTGQVEVRGRDLADLEPTQVIVEGGEVRSRSPFSTETCGAGWTPPAS